MEESLRMMERILATLLGGFFAWLGYRLFLDVPIKQNSSGEFKLPKGIAIHLTRVGPGVFFALFGAAAVCSSFYSQVTVRRSESHVQTAGDKTSASIVADQQKQKADPPAGSAKEVDTTEVTKEFTGIAGEGDGPPQEVLHRRNEVKTYVKFLNDLSVQLDAKPELAELRANSNSLPQIKLAVMEMVWYRDWGDRASFENWVNLGADDSRVPTNANKGPYEYFKFK
jgi:hypothetical protein